MAEDESSNRIPRVIVKELQRQDSETLNTIADYANKLAGTEQQTEKSGDQIHVASIIAMTNTKSTITTK